MSRVPQIIAHFLVIFLVSVSSMDGENEENPSKIAFSAFDNLKNLINNNKDPKGQPVTILRLQSSNINGVKDLAVRNATTEIAMEVRIDFEQIRKLQNDLNQNICVDSQLSLNKIRNQVLRRAGFCSKPHFEQIRQKIESSIEQIAEFDYMIRDVEEELKKCASNEKECYELIVRKIERYSADYNIEFNSIFERMRNFSMSESMEVAKCFKIAIEEGRVQAKKTTSQIMKCLTN